MLKYIKNLFCSKSEDFKKEENYTNYTYNIPIIHQSKPLEKVDDPDDILIFEKFKKLIEKYPPSEWSTSGAYRHYIHIHPHCDYRIETSNSQYWLNICDLEFISKKYANMAFELWNKTLSESIEAKKLEKKRKFLNEDFSKEFDEDF